jgi:hypothetical protein
MVAFSLMCEDIRRSIALVTKSGWVKEVWLHLELIIVVSEEVWTCDN